MAAIFSQSRPVEDERRMAAIFSQSRPVEDNALERTETVSFEETRKFVHCELCPSDLVPSQLTGVLRLRKLVHLTLEDPSFSSLARSISIVIIVCIAVSTTVFCINTLPELENNPAFLPIEAVVVGIFTLEYLCRLLCCKHIPRFAVQMMNIVDLLSM
jgi:hypothetical protein